MLYKFYFKETETKAKIFLTYPNTPSNKVMTELLESYDGYIEIEKELMPEDNGKAPVEYCNPVTGEYWLEYIDIPPQPPTPEKRIEQLEQAVLELSMLVGGKA